MIPLETPSSSCLNQIYKPSKMSFKKATFEDEAIVSASLRISQIIAKKMKPFSDVFIFEAINDFLLAAVEELAPAKVKDIRKINLSRQTVTRRIDLVSNQISNTLKTSSNSFTYFTLAFDKTTNILDTSQLSIFVGGVNDEMKVTEDFFGCYWPERKNY